MSALDDAIQAHLAHPAGSGFDPLTDSLAEQAAARPPLRAGWETEPIVVPMPWRVALVAFLLGLFGFGLSGCASFGAMPPGFAAAQDPPAALMAACPPLADLKRWNPDALSLRVAEAERWYQICRDAALAGTPARAPRLLP